MPPVFPYLALLIKFNSEIGERSDHIFEALINHEWWRGLQAIADSPEKRVEYVCRTLEKNRRCRKAVARARERNVYFVLREDLIGIRRLRDGPDKCKKDILMVGLEEHP